MAPKYKLKCIRCKKNYALASWRDRYVTCIECQKKDMSKEITDPEMKKFFDIPEELYNKSNFLRDIKINYLRYGSLTEKQIEAFKKAVIDLKEEK